MNADSQAIELAHVGVELRLTGDDGRAQIRQPLVGRFELGRERHGPGVELGRALPRGAELPKRGLRRARPSRRERRAPRRRGGSDLRSPRVPRTGAAGRGSAARRPVAARPGGERSPRRLRPDGDRARRAPLPPDTARGSSCSPFSVRRSVSSEACCSCASKPTTAFSCLWCSAVESGNGVRGGCDRPLERGRLFGEPQQRAPLNVNPLAQLLDFALRLENPACVVAASARDQLRSPENGAIHGHDRYGSQAARRLGAVVRIGDPRLADRMRDGAGEWAVHADGRRQRNKTVWSNPAEAGSHVCRCTASSDRHVCRSPARRRDRCRRRDR